MQKQTQMETDGVAQLTEEAHSLMAATAGLAEHGVAEARRRLAVALERTKEVCGEVREKAVEGARAADGVVRKYPYQAIAIGLGIGALIGYLAARQRNRNSD